jgi:hypothetical protein
MQSSQLKLVLLLGTWSVLLGGCETYSPHPYSSHPKKTHPGKIRYVETENMNWDSAKEQDQELADEI